MSHEGIQVSNEYICKQSYWANDYWEPYLSWATLLCLSCLTSTDCSHITVLLLVICFTSGCKHSLPVNARATVRTYCQFTRTHDSQWLNSEVIGAVSHLLGWLETWLTATCQHLHTFSQVTASHTSTWSGAGLEGEPVWLPVGTFRHRLCVEKLFTL